LSESRLAAESSHDAVELAVVAEAEKGFSASGSPGMFENLLRIQKKFANEGKYPAFLVAETSGLLGRKRDALDYLAASYKQRELYMATLPVSPALVSLHSDPAYRRLMAQLGVDVPN